MSDDKKFELTRRKMLGAAGTVGAVGALGGASTMAVFNDQENSTGNAITAGKLDLKIDWEESYNGEEVEDQELTDNPGPIFELGDVKPGDWGEATISLHNYDNPAWVHMAGALTANDDNGLTEPEGEVDSTGGDGEGELADEIQATLWYDGTDEDADGKGGNNEFDGDELLIAEGSLREVLNRLDGGILLGNQAAGMTGSSTTGTTATAEFCGEFQGGPQAQQCIDCLPCDDPSVLATPTGLSGFCYEPGTIPGGATHVTLKAGQNCYLAPVSSSTTEICLPEDAKHEISNATFYRCPTNGGGGGGGGGGCFPNSTTQYLGLSWELPKSVGNEVQSDSVTFDLRFHAQQCRHVDDPTNPYVETIEVTEGFGTNSGDRYSLVSDAGYPENMVTTVTKTSDPVVFELDLPKPLNDSEGDNFALTFDADDDGTADFQVVYNDGWKYKEFNGGWGSSQSLPGDIGTDVVESGGTYVVEIPRSYLSNTFAFGGQLRYNGEEPNNPGQNFVVNLVPGFSWGSGFNGDASSYYDISLL